MYSVGGITGFTLTAAVDERDAVIEIVPSLPLRQNMKDFRDPAAVTLLMRVRRLIETVIGQLAGRFYFEQVQARDLWHFESRIRSQVARSYGLFL